MLKKILVIISISLIFLIINRPPKNIGIRTIATKTNLLGSPSSAELILNNLTFVLIILYFVTILNIYSS